MIPRPPSGTGIRLFRAPCVHLPGNRASGRTVNGVWSRIVSRPPADPALEAAYTRATRAYYAGQFDEALAILDAEMRRADLPHPDRVGLELARVETLLVMGRTADGYGELRALVGEHRSGAYVHRCWLWAAQRELGLAAEARSELDWLDSDLHVATPSDAINIHIGMSFFAWIGELEIAEHMVVRMLRARTMAAWRAPDVIEGNTRLGWLAAQGPAGEAGAQWGDGLLDRAHAEATRLGPL